MNPQGHWQRGVLGVVLAVACFATLDSLTKLLGTMVPLVVVLWTRYLFMTTATSAGQLPQRGRRAWHTRHLPLQLLRGTSLLLCSVFAFLSLQHMPVGEFTAVVMLTPLVITGAAAALLGERVSLWRWLCVLGGFGGAMLVIRPDGDDLNWALLYPLGLVASNAAYQVLTSRLARLSEDVGTMQLYTGAVGLLAASLLLPFFGSVPGEAKLWGLLALTGLMGWLGHRFLSQAYQHAPASRLTPFLYLQIAFGMLMGWLLFGQVPDAWAVTGVLLITACGVAGTQLAQREHGKQTPAAV